MFQNKNMIEIVILDQGLMYNTMRKNIFQLNSKTLSWKKKQWTYLWKWVLEKKKKVSGDVF